MNMSKIIWNQRKVYDTMDEVVATYLKMFRPMLEKLAAGKLDIESVDDELMAQLNELFISSFMLGKEVGEAHEYEDCF